MRQDPFAVKPPPRGTGSGLFAVTRRGEGVVSLRVATDAQPYLGRASVGGLADALSTVVDDSTVRAVVLEGGEQYFCAGASRESVIEIAAAGHAQDYVSRIPRSLLGLPLPVIAAAAGHAVGGGLLLALWCDAAVLAEESLYGANFMALGLVPGMGATHAMPEAFGAPLGRELLLSGRLLTGREIAAACCPLSHAVRPRARVFEQALDLAHEMAQVPRNALMALKQELADARLGALEAALRAEECARARLVADPAARREIEQRYPVSFALGDRTQ